MNKTGKNDGIMSNLIGNIHNQNDRDNIAEMEWRIRKMRFDFKDKIKFTRAVFYSFRPIPLPKPLRMELGGWENLLQRGDAWSFMIRREAVPT